ncbi:MAG TPA: hypothetical protein PLF13_13515 [candidate division Zixibacteria bacterium]|nr:hypothetical protein [candidate division Zixibacteria bacterium]
MRSFLLFLAVACLAVFIGCSNDSKSEIDQPPYDLVANPDGFPDRAIELLQKIEDGQLVMYDLIVDNFADLYMVHPDLLENEKWHRVIRQVGRRFEDKAERLSARGIQFYLQAAGYYRLAAFADPDDDKLSEISRLFDTWSEGMAAMAAIDQVVRDFEDLDEACRVVRYFLFGNELQQRFGREYLTDKYLKALLDKEPSTVRLQSLEPVNQALLAWMGYYPAYEASPIGEFSRIPVELQATAIYPLDSIWTRFEFFVIAKDSTLDIGEMTALCNSAVESDMPTPVGLQERPGMGTGFPITVAWGRAMRPNEPGVVGLIAAPNGKSDTLWMGL